MVWLRRSAALVACLAAAVLGAAPAPGEAARRPLRVLQMNLCDSGFAGCYTGRAVPAAAALIRQRRPDVVTLNEICRDDVDTLGDALAGVYPGDTVVRAFQPAFDRRTAAPFLCRNGRPYGIGLIARLPAPLRVHRQDGGLYPDQDTGDPEERAWLCVHVPGAFAACTTHLANTSPPVALAQCGFLLNTAIPALPGRTNYDPTVIAADFNLAAGGSPNIHSCVPPGWLREDDGSVQHVMVSAGYAVAAHAAIDMAPVTDHPSLLVALVATPR